MMAFKERMYLRSFQEISKILSSTLAVDEVLDQIARQITEVMNLKGATIRLVNPKTNRLELVAAHGLSDKVSEEGRRGPGQECHRGLERAPGGHF